ncbi:outer membrane efflux protein [Galbibacter marinus]|uniref:Outer membrane efflux protein n=1 Tax=Galbibacter marinus TaxID=555500 RepID=K2P0N2_9FLAO|nr:TolC family protein [Galbibacter marinus]EKF54613.1 outer membrane efflux protein [Galbibacter marinus]
MIKIITVLIYLLASVLCFAQQNTELTLTLEQCLEMALDNNLDLKRSRLSKDASSVSFKQSKSQMLPTLNGNYNLGVSNGRSIDPYTNDYVDQKLTFSNAGLNLNLTIFNGFKLLNTIRSQKYELNAAKMEVEEQKQNLILEVTLNYLQILSSKDLLQLANSRLETTKNQLKRLKSLYEEEVGNPADYMDMKGQLASDMTNVINANNNLEEAKLNLFLLLNMEPHIEAEFVNMHIKDDIRHYQYTSEEVYKEALANLATFKAKASRLNAAKMEVKVAQSGYVPEVSLFGQLNTNYSSAAQLFSEKGTSLVETGGFITIDDVNYPVMENETLFYGEEIDYMDQLKNNVYTSFGIAVTIPLLNGFESKNNVALGKIKLEETKLDLLNTKREFKNAIEHAYLQMESALKRYYIYQEQSEAFDESFRINEIRFNNGVSNIVEYLTSKNNMDNAMINLANSKYEYLLRVRVLEYYRGV